MAKECKIISDRDAIYFAGLFDGEGCVNICEHRRPASGGYVNPYFRAGLSVANTHHGVLLWAKEHIGGQVGESMRGTPTKDGTPRSKIWRWSASSRESLHILKHILPYLIVKHDQASLMIEFQKFVDDSIHKKRPGRLSRAGNPAMTSEEVKKRREYVAKMKALNHRNRPAK